MYQESSLHKENLHLIFYNIMLYVRLLKPYYRQFYYRIIQWPTDGRCFSERFPRFSLYGYLIQYWETWEALLVTITRPHVTESKLGWVWITNNHQQLRPGQYLFNSLQLRQKILVKCIKTCSLQLKTYFDWAEGNNNHTDRSCLELVVHSL